MTFGKLIAEARKKAGLSQKDLASKIKKEDGNPISAQYLNDIEHDRRNPPSEVLNAQFAKELKLPTEYLVLAAGSLPRELQKTLSSLNPEKGDRAFTAFRKTIKKEE